MVEKLKAYRDELVEKKAEILSSDIIGEVEAEAAIYKEKLLKEKKAEQDKIVDAIDSDIKCIDGIIAKEEAKIEAAKAEEATQASIKEAPVATGYASFGVAPVKPSDVVSNI